MRRILLVVLVASCGSKESPPPPPAAKDAAVVVEVPRDAARPGADAAPAVEHATFRGFAAVAEGASATDEDAAALAGLRPLAPECDADPDTATRLALTGDVDATRPGPERVIVSLSHGVVAPPLRSAEPFADCGGSQSELGGAWVGQVVPDEELEIVVTATSGGKNFGAETLHVFKRRDDRLVEILAHTLTEYEGDAETSFPIERREDGSIVVTREGKPVTLTWHEDRFGYHQ